MKNKTRTFEKGQAFSELIISIVGIIIVFSGLLIVAEMAKGNIENLLEARAEADSSAVGGVGGDGLTVYTWDEGGDGLIFTADDAENLSASSNDDIQYTGVATGIFRSEMLRPPVPLSYDFDSYFYSSGQVFLDAAELVSHQSTRTIPEDAEFITPEMIEFVGGQSQIQIEDTIYTPAVSP